PSDHPTTPRLLRVHTLEGKIEESEARVSKLSEPLEGVVGASIPNDDHFDVLVRLGQSGAQSPLEEELAAIVGRDPDLDQWRYIFECVTICAGRPSHQYLRPQLWDPVEVRCRQPAQLCELLERLALPLGEVTSKRRQVTAHLGAQAVQLCRQHCDFLAERVEPDEQLVYLSSNDSVQPVLDHGPEPMRRECAGHFAIINAEGWQGDDVRDSARTGARRTSTLRPVEEAGLESVDPSTVIGERPAAFREEIWF